jgi:hypothetical protein
MKTKKEIIREAKSAADYMLNGIHRDNTWTRVCLIYKGSHAATGIERLTKALSIHFDGVGFGSQDLGAHWEIACANAETAALAREYVNGWLAK